MNALNSTLLAMNDGQIQLTIIVAYLGLVLFLGFFASRLFRGTKKDYLLASHSIGPFLLLLCMFGTTMTAFTLVGSSGEAYLKGIGVYGMLASSSAIIHSLCFYLIGIKIYRFGRQHGYATQIQFFRDRLESDFIGIVLFPILVGLIIPYLMIGVMAGGGVMQVMSAGAFENIEAFQVLKENGDIDVAKSGGLPPYLGSLLICAVVLIYVFFGGMRGTTWANAFQTFVFMSLGIVTFYSLAMKLGGGETIVESLTSVMKKIDVMKRSRANMPQTKFFSYMLIPLSVAMFPHLFQHWLTAKSAKTFKLPIVVHPIFIMIIWAPCVMIGVWATGLDIPDTIKPNNVLAYLVTQQFGPLMTGFLAAGILAAIMSSLDSQFLCVGSIFTNDIVCHYLGKDRFSDRTQIWIARIFIIAIVGVTYWLSLQGYRSVFTMAVWCFSGYSALFPIVFAALYWKRLTAAGVLSGILALAGSWFYLFRESQWGQNADYALMIFGEEHPIMPVVGIMICTIAAMVITSFMTKAPTEKTLAKFFGGDYNFDNQGTNGENAGEA